MTRQTEAPQTSSSMEEVAAKRPEEVRAPTLKDKPDGAHSLTTERTPPQSSLRADSSSTEEERGAKAWLRLRARSMRAEMTDAKKAMWRLLREGELVALNWRKQAPFGVFILDFVSHPARLVVEVDGSQHGESEKARQDAVRTAWINSQGYQILRFWNNDVLKASDGVWQAIHSGAAATPASARMKRWRDDHMATIRQANERPASSSMEEEPRSGGGGARAEVNEEPPEASLQGWRATPPQSSLRDDSSSIEEEHNA